MSFQAMRWAAELHIRPPLAKLVLLQIANHHNMQTGWCNPSAELIAFECGLSASQTHSLIKTLVAQNLLARQGHHYLFPLVTDKLEPVPYDWFPSEEIVADIVAQYPNHDFSMEEATHDWITFTRRAGLRYAPGTRGQAFFRSISRILESRAHGRVSFAGGNKPNSVLAALSGDDGVDPQLGFIFGDPRS